jgi:hypothetical protein
MKKKVKTWNPLVKTICPIKEVKTFFEIRFAVGRFGWIRAKGSVRPTVQRNERR